MIQLSGFFTDRLIFSHIEEYLNIQDILILSCTCHDMMNLMQQVCIQILNSNNLSIIPLKTPIHQMRFYFNRCLRIFRNQNMQQNLQLTIEKLFKFSVIAFFDVGSLFCVCLNSIGTAYIFRTSHLTSLHNPKQLNYIIRNQVKDIACKGQQLVYINNKSQVYLISTIKKEQEIILNEQLIAFSKKILIDKVYASYHYMLLILQPQTINVNNIYKYVYGINIQQQQQSELGIYILIMNFNTNLYYFTKIYTNQIISCAVGSKQAYIVSEDKMIYLIDFENIKQGQKQLICKPFEPLKDKQIIKVTSGFSFYLALERKVENISNWNIDRVVNWLQQIGLRNYEQVARSQELDGNKLISIDRKYINNVLGITKPNMQQKLMMEVEEIKAQKRKKDTLYGWGKNQYGQLGSISANYIIVPKKIKINFLKNQEYIDNIFCGWLQTFIRTQKGRIYRTIINIQKKIRKNIKHQINSDQELLNKNQSQEDFKIKIKRRKKTQDYREEKKNKKIQEHKDKEQGRNKKDKGKRFEEEERWMECDVGKAFYVQGFKNNIFYIQCPVHNKFQPSRQKKLRTAKAIIDRILWDSSIDKKDFTVGYIDKQMGLIQASLLEMHSESKIRYIKKNNIIVWNRQQKLDNLI